MESDKKPIGNRFKDISKEILVRVECPSIFENASFFSFSSHYCVVGVRGVFVLFFKTSLI